MSNDVNLQTDQLEESFELPTKYKGKSAAEIAKMHMEAEAEKSRLGNEVGTLRSMADRLLGLEQERTKTTRAERKPVTTDDILTNPDEAIERAIEEHPEIKTLREEVQQSRIMAAQARFEKDHPKYLEDLQNPEFVDWVKRNKVRTALGVAANGGDYDAAGSLWSLWEEHNNGVKESRAEKEAARKKAERLGTLEGGGTSGLESDKIYSRADLMDLRMKALNGDPTAKAKWNDPAFQAEYQKAYAEKRVR